MCFPPIGTSSVPPPPCTPLYPTILPSRHLSPFSHRRRRRAPTLQAPPADLSHPSGAPLSSATGVIFGLASDLPAAASTGSKPRRERPRPVRARARACVRVSLGACMRAPRRSGARARTRYPRARVPRTNTRVCWGGGGDMFAGLCPHARGAGAALAPASTARAPSAAVRAAGRRSNRDGFKQAVPI